MAKNNNEMGDEAIEYEGFDVEEETENKVLKDEDDPKRLYGYKDVVKILNILSGASDYKKSRPHAKFTEEEVSFIIGYIFHKNLVYKEIPGAVAGLIESNHMLGYPISPTNYRYVRFYKHFIMSGGNATKAAIAAGYSPRTAKQQGYRLLKNYRFRYTQSRNGPE